MLVLLVRIIIALTILFIVFFAYMKKDMLPKLVTYTILTSIALSMALSGFAGLISDVDFLSFLVRIFRTLADLVVYVEVALIVFLLFFSKFKSKTMLLKVVIMVYVVLTLLLAFGVLN